MKATETIVEVPTFDSLNEINYTSLKDKFTELGIESAWRAGVKKADLINLALEKLAEIKEIEDTAVETLIEKELKDALAETLEDGPIEMTAEEILAEDLRVEKELKDSEETEELEKEEIKSHSEETPKISKVIIEKNLKAVLMSMKTATLMQKGILVKKQVELEKMLKEY